MKINLEHSLEHSYRDFHVKGMDYVCLKRADDRTVKLYFFNGDVSKLPEVVNPHDHRYDFDTFVLHGCVANRIYARRDWGKDVYHQFDYQTPLNGGNGFTWVGECRLAEISERMYWSGGHYPMRHDEIHTIQIVRPQTFIMLVQYPDKVPLDGKTTTFIKDREPPSLDGLYRKFTVDQLKALMYHYTYVTGQAVTYEGET